MELIPLNEQIIMDLEKVFERIKFGINLDQLSIDDLSKIAHILININNKILEIVE